MGRQERLKELRTEVEKIKSQAEAEERDLTAEELDKLQPMLDEMEKLIEEIKAKKRLEKVEKSLEEPEERTVKPEGLNKPSGEWNSFGEFIQAVILAGSPPGEFNIDGRRSGTIDPRLTTAWDKEERASGLNEGIPSQGGFLVQPDYAQELIQLAHKTAVLVPMCRKFTLTKNANSIEIPAVDETSRADGSRWGGIRVYTTAEAEAKTASKPKFKKLKLKLNKLTGLCYLTDELLEDVSFLEDWVKTGFAEEFGFKLDDLIINGSGAGEPMGIYNSGALVTVAKETGQTASTILAENIEKMYSRMWSPSVGKAVWLINQDCWPQIFQLHHVIGTGGVPMFVPPNGLSGAPYGTLLGRPIIPIEQCQTLGTKGDIYFVDLSQYLLIDKGGMKSASSIHVRFLYDETALRFVYRVDGQPIWSSTLTPYKGSNTVSPYVALATRS